MTYAEKLRDPRWQKKRLEVMERDKFTCCQCRSDTKTLNVHHKFYFRGKMPWEYPDWCYQTLCEGCHKTAGDQLAWADYVFHTFFHPEELAVLASRLLKVIYQGSAPPSMLAMAFHEVANDPDYCMRKSSELMSQMTDEKRAEFESRIQSQMKFLQWDKDTLEMFSELLKEQKCPKDSSDQA